MLLPLQRLAIPAIAGFLLLLPLSSEAAETLRTEGATLSLIAEPPQPDGTIRAALRVELMPGWKTYWLDPGDAGIPPMLDFAGSIGLTGPKALFPAPVRFGEGDGASSIGYVKPFSIAIETDSNAATAPKLSVHVTLGLCRELCVPVVADLEVDPEEAHDAGAVHEAFAALPRASGPEDGIIGLRLSPDAKELEVEVKPAARTAAADLFVAAPGWLFGTPIAAKDGRMTLPVLRKPRKPGPLPEAEAVLVTKDESFRTTATIAKIGG